MKSKNEELSLTPLECIGNLFIVALQLEELEVPKWREPVRRI
jgi:hypothetical protein